MRKILSVLLAILIFSSASFAETGKLIDESTLLVENGRTFTVRFSSDVDTRPGNLEYVRIERDDGKNLDVSRSASGNKVTITLREDLAIGHNYAVIVDPGLRGIKGDIVRKKYRRPFLPKYNISMTAARKIYDNAIESAEFKLGLYSIGAKREFKNSLDTIDKLKKHHIDKGDFSSNEAKLVSAIMEAVQRFNSNKYVNPQDMVFSNTSIKIDDNDKANMTFNFKYPWKGDLFDKDLEGFKVTLKRDEESFTSITIHKEDYSRINRMERMAYYENRTDFKDLLESEDIQSGFYKIEIRPILKSVPLGDSKVAVADFVDLTKPKMPNFYFRDDFNIIVFDEIPKPRPSSEIWIALSNDGKEISFKQDDLTQIVDSDLIGRKFDPGQGKLSRSLTPTEMNLLFGGATGNVGINAYSVDKGFNDAKSGINKTTINLVAYDLPQITDVSGRKVVSTAPYNKSNIEKVMVKNNVDLTVKTANANDGTVHLYKFKDETSPENIKESLEKAAKLRYGDKISYSDFETTFHTELNSFDLLESRYQKIEGNVASFNIKDEQLGRYFIVLEHNGLWFPVEGFYLDIINGYESEMKVGYMSAGVFVEKDVFKHPNTSPDEEKIFVSLTRKADLYLLDEGQYTSFSNASGDEAKKKELDSNNLWTSKDVDGYVELEGSEWRDKKDSKFHVVAVTEGNNFSEVAFTIINGSPPNIEDINIMLRNVDGRDEGKCLITYTTDKDISLYVVKSDVVFAKPDKPTQEELQEKSVLHFVLKKDQNEIDEKVDSQPWFDDESEFKKYYLYAVDEAGNVTEKMENKMSTFKKAMDIGLSYTGLKDGKLENYVDGFKVPEIELNGVIQRKEYIGYKLSDVDPFTLDSPYLYDLVEWTGATLPIKNVITHDEAPDGTNWILLYVFDDIGGVKKLIRYTYLELER